MDTTRTNYIILAFSVGWTKTWNSASSTSPADEFDIAGDSFKRFVIDVVDSKARREYNKLLAEQFGVVVTKIKTFPTQNGTWIILDKHTKYVLHKDIRNETEVDFLCLKNNYVR